MNTLKDIAKVPPNFHYYTKYCNRLNISLAILIECTSLEIGVYAWKMALAAIQALTVRLIFCVEVIFLLLKQNQNFKMICFQLKKLKIENKFNEN